ncbi:hypothetical protein Pcinc_019852 [Petrolisthes cinctipes]|uniref:Uncharacterized protein n=1 Tax=Petrolisthes cinctipes TaxID=88211 RepID=A0AAE1FNX2_PETCI|nr:hypothetical protein Pcinc_019852 [Petrolisthes cinctipes]
MAAGEQRSGYGSGGSGSRNTATIVQDDRTQNAYGEYSFTYETSDGTYRQESGAQNDGQTSKGGWRYSSPEGRQVEINFVADQGGYQPSGNVLPVAPPLPYQRTQQFIH